MKKDENRTRDCIVEFSDIISLACGIILVLIGLITYEFSAHQFITTLFEVIGSSLVAAGFVSILIRRLSPKEIQDKIAILAKDRSPLGRDFKNLKYKASNVDIVAIALSDGLCELATDQKRTMINRVLFNGAKVRMAFLSPKANYVEQRALEDGVQKQDLVDTLEESVRYCIWIYCNILSTLNDAKSKGNFDNTGRIEIRLIDTCPHFTLYRADEKLLWGLYTSSGRGVDSATLDVPMKQKDLYRQLTNHFETLWTKSFLNNTNDDGFIVRYYGAQKLTLNFALIENILGPKWLEDLKLPTYCHENLKKLNTTT